jgi:hypothetical protein
MSRGKVSTLPLSGEEAKSLIDMVHSRPRLYLLWIEGDRIKKAFHGIRALFALVGLIGLHRSLEMLKVFIHTSYVKTLHEISHRNLEMDLARRRFISSMVSGGAVLSLLLGVMGLGIPTAQALPPKKKTLERIQIRRYVDLDSRSVREGELINLRKIKVEKTDAEVSSSAETLLQKRIGDADLLVVKTKLRVTGPERKVYEVVTLGFINKGEDAELAVITRGLLSNNGSLKHVSTLALYEPLGQIDRETYGYGYVGSSPSLTQHYQALAKELAQLESPFIELGKHMRLLADVIAKEGLDFEIDGRWEGYAIDSPSPWNCFWCVVCGAVCAFCVGSCVTSFEWWACIACAFGCVSCYCPCAFCIYEQCPGPPCCP